MRRLEFDNLYDYFYGYERLSLATYRGPCFGIGIAPDSDVRALDIYGLPSVSGAVRLAEGAPLAWSHPVELHRAEVDSFEATSGRIALVIAETAAEALALPTAVASGVVIRVDERSGALGHGLREYVVQAPKASRGCFFIDGIDGDAAALNLLYMPVDVRGRPVLTKLRSVATQYLPGSPLAWSYRLPFQSGAVSIRVSGGSSAGPLMFTAGFGIVAADAAKLDPYAIPAP